MNDRITVLCMSWLQGPQDSLQEFMDATHQDEDIQVVLEDSGTQSADAVIVWTDLALGTPEGLPQLLGSLSKTPVFVVASAANSQTMLEIVRLGAHDCFPKSEATPASLLRATRHAVHRQSSRTEHDDVALANVKEEIARSQQQLRDSEALYHSLVENLVQNIFRKDLDGRFTFANTNFCLAIGRHVDQVLGKTDFDFFPQDLATKYQSDDHKVIANGQALEAEEEHVTAADERLVVKVVKTPVYNAAGEIVGMQGIFWDITEQKRAQEDLVASRERFALAVQGSTAGIWDWDIATNEIYFSSRFRELLGHGSDELENRFIEWENRMHPDDQEMALAAIDNHLQSDAPFDVEYRLLCKDDDYRWFRVRGLAVRNGKGKATRMAGSISDITTRKEAESQLHERTADLERSNRDLEQFAYIASHDLKEPLRMVTSYVQLLEHRYKDKLDDDARDFIGFAVDGSKRMKRLIDGLLEFSRIGTHGREFAPTHTEGVLEESLSNLEVLIREKEAKVTHDPLPDVIADPLQLGQLFQNLVGNALKFCKDVPQVHISVERDKTAEQVIISVKDNGIGINPDHVEKIFQIYQRLHRRADYEGTGIGLAVCRKIVERHGGEIRVDSELGQGSTFHFNMKAVASES